MQEQSRHPKDFRNFSPLLLLAIGYLHEAAARLHTGENPYDWYF